MRIHNDPKPPIYSPRSLGDWNPPVIIIVEASSISEESIGRESGNESIYHVNPNKVGEFAEILKKHLSTHKIISVPLSDYLMAKIQYPFEIVKNMMES